MPERPELRLRPSLERLEPKQTLSGGMATPAVGAAAGHPAVAAAFARHQAVLARQEAATANFIAASNVTGAVSPDAIKPEIGYLIYRVTNPNRYETRPTGPFGHVLVQQAKPIPGQVYNILQLVVRNSSAQTLTASDNALVKFPGQTYFTPILTGNQTWKPGQWFIFYVMTKKYYPIQNQVTGGFLFVLGGAPSVAIPGPSGIFLRVRYNPATIDRQLDYIVLKGPGAEGGSGLGSGMADTALYAFTPSAAKRNDYGGYF